jgi:hypothetical protein
LNLGGRNPPNSIRKKMKVHSSANKSITVGGVEYNEKNGSMEVPDEIGLMLIETFGFEEVKKQKKSKED